MNFNNYNGNESNSKKQVSFRGKEIPEIIKKMNYEIADSFAVIDKIKNMPVEEQKKVTLDAAHFDGWRIADVKLSTGDIVPVETAIALAENNMLDGYSTGATMRGGRTLRSKPSTDDSPDDRKGIYDLPRF